VDVVGHSCLSDQAPIDKYESDREVTGQEMRVKGRRGNMREERECEDSLVIGV